ncbi:MAG TPA: FAD-dependent oxidoreductase [Xanthomonadaceae bacterium]|jgi:monoamine oxidase
MARTPLFDALQRAARIAHLARRSALPIDETIERAREARLQASRRRFLRDACGAAATLALVGPAGRLMAAPVPAPADGEEVVIVGAGIAGLTAAWRLRQAGVRVRMIEANRRIGGRMQSLRNFFPDDQVAELGGELIDTGHVRIRALAAELGLQLDDLRGGDPLAEADTWWAQGRRHSEAELIHAFIPVAAAIAHDLKAIGEGDITYATPLGAKALDALTITQWFDRHDVKGWLRSLLDVAYTTEMGLACDRQSALNLLTFIGTRPDRFRVFGESDERYHVRGGNDQIPRGLAARLEDAIETDTALEALGREDSGRYVLSLRRGAASRELRARTVLLALPFTTLRDVRIEVPLPPDKQRAIRELKYGTNAKLMVGFERRVWREHKANGSTYADLPFQTTWDTSRKQGGTHGVLTNFVGGQHGVDIGQDTPKAQADKVARQLDALFPGIAGARKESGEVRMHWPTQPWTRGSYACFGPGDWTTIRGAIGETVEQLYFAGEHCAFDTQGFMEGGCESGEKAAAAILKARRIASPVQDRKAAAA